MENEVKKAEEAASVLNEGLGDTDDDLDIIAMRTEDYEAMRRDVMRYRDALVRIAHTLDQPGEPNRSFNSSIQEIALKALGIA